MRGPGLRLDLDVRRVWTCPECRRQRRLPGEVSTAYCPCREGGVMMQLTSDSVLLRRAERLSPLPFIKREPPPWWADRESQRQPDVKPTPPPGPIPDPLPTPIPDPQPNPIPDPGPPPFPDPEPGPRNETSADDFGNELGLPDGAP